jgi:hypothetical protein
VFRSRNGAANTTRSHSSFCPAAHDSSDLSPCPRCNPSLRIIRWGASLRSIFLVLVLLIQCTHTRRAEAELGPCKTAAPTTPKVIVFVSDLDRSMRWYRDTVGLDPVGLETSSPSAIRQLGSIGIEMTQDRVGVTLVFSGGASHPSREPQMVCFVLEGPPAPLPGSPPLFLVDPDGISVEVPALPTPAQR